MCSAMADLSRCSSQLWRQWSITSGHVSRGGAQCLLTATHPAAPHYHPLNQTKIHGSHHNHTFTNSPLCFPSLAYWPFWARAPISPKPPPWDPISLTTSAPASPHHSYDSLDLSTLCVGSLPTTPLHLFTSPFPRPAKLPLFSAILNSCSWLILAHFMVAWKPRGFTLSCGRDHENWVPFFHFSPVSCIIRNSV